MLKMKEHPDILDGDDEADEADMEIEIVIKCGLEYGKYARGSFFAYKRDF